MNKKVVAAVLKRSEGLCEIEGCKSHDRVQLHHIIYGKGRRKQHECEHSIIALCWTHHLSNIGVHGKDGHDLSISLKRDLQNKYFSMGHSEDETRIMMGGMLV